jgi:hypothetical protein
LLIHLGGGGGGGRGMYERGEKYVQCFDEKIS